MLKYIILLCVALVFFDDFIHSVADKICVLDPKRRCREQNECKKSGNYCCDKQGHDLGNGYCCSSCIEQSCLADEDCGRNECCYRRKCVDCSSLHCSSNLVCGSGYCCKAGSLDSRCFPSGCIGQECDSSGDCGGTKECCRNKRCADCFSSTCNDDSECRFGDHCCREATVPICSRSCSGGFCISDEECAGNGTCCIKNTCTTDGCLCRSNSDCAHERYCCVGDTNPACSIHCIGKQCSSDSDCGGPEEICTCPDRACISATKYTDTSRPQKPVAKCFNKNGCSSHGDCKVFGTGYYCCKETDSSPQNCSSNCLNKFCNRDSDCGGSGECCGPRGKCKKCHFPLWVTGVIVVGFVIFLNAVGFASIYYFKLRRRRLERLQSRGGGTEMEPLQRNSNRSQNSVDRSLVHNDQTPSLGNSPLQTQQIQSLPSPNAETDNEYSVIQSNNSNVKNEEGETVSLDVPPPSYRSIIPSCPPPSYQELFVSQ